MRAVIQRVKRATLSVSGEVVSSIGGGLMVLVGVTDSDTKKDMEYIGNKIVGLRVFNDENGVMNVNVGDSQNEIMVVSQFTLYADCRKGNRPSFIKAGAPQMAESLYKHFMERCRTHVDVVEKGRFGADMKVELLNDGPFTLMLDSQELFGE